MLTLGRSHLGVARLDSAPDPFSGPAPSPLLVPHVRDVPGVLASPWERAARPWERERTRSPFEWFIMARSWATAAASLAATGHLQGADRMGGYAVACRRRGEAEEAIAAKRSVPGSMAMDWGDVFRFAWRG